MDHRKILGRFGGHKGRGSHPVAQQSADGPCTSLHETVARPKLFHPPPDHSPSASPAPGLDACGFLHDKRALGFCGMPIPSISEATSVHPRGVPAPGPPFLGAFSVGFKLQHQRYRRKPKRLLNRPHDSIRSVPCKTLFKNIYVCVCVHMSCASFVYQYIYTSAYTCMPTCTYMSTPAHVSPIGCAPLVAAWLTQMRRCSSLEAPQRTGAEE